MSAKRISDLRGLGPTSARWLERVGVSTEDDLKQIGAVEAFARVRLAAAPHASLNLLYALEAALRNVDWRSLPEATKRALRDEFAQGGS